MSMHRQDDGPLLTGALCDHGLATDTPSQLSDAFRLGWSAQTGHYNVDERTYTQAEWDAMRKIAYAAGYYQHECGLPDDGLTETLTLKECSTYMKAQQERRQPLTNHLK